MVLSSEFVSVAVLQGKLDAATGTTTQTAEPGQVLVSPIEGRETERFFFDAAVLARSLPPELGAETLPLLTQIAAQQKRQRFFGLIEPVGINASAPAPGPVEAMRLTYLSDPAIIDIRQRAGGDIKKRGRMTAERFASALVAGDAETLASLIDPKPFTDVTLDAARWRSARLSFAQKLTANAPLIAALSQTRVSDAPNAAPDAKSFLLEREGAPAFRITIVDRDRASFVATLEPAS